MTRLRPSIIPRCTKKGTITKATNNIKSKKTLRKHKHQRIRSDSLINYLRGNTLSDWLVKKAKATVQVHISQAPQLKERVHSYITTKCSDITICKMQDIPNAFETLTAMKEGHKVIENPCLIDRSEGIVECPDFLVRSDVVTVLFPYLKFIPSGKQHYYVSVNLYHGTLYADDIRSMKDGTYLELRQYMQNKVLYKYRQAPTAFSSVGLVVSRNCRKGGKTYTNFINHVTMIHGDGSTYASGRRWLHLLDKDYLSWSAVPKPTVTELYANAQIHSKEILDIAKEQDDITLLWGCEPEQRAYAHEDSIYRAKDLPSARAVRFNGYAGQVLDKFIEGGQPYYSLNDHGLDVDKWVVLHLESVVLYEYGEKDCVGTEYVYAGGCDENKFGLDAMGPKPETVLKFSPADLEKQLVVDLHAYLSELVLTNGSLAIYCWGTSALRYLALLEVRYNVPVCTDFGAYLFDICDFMIQNSVIWTGMQDYTLFSIAGTLQIPYNYDNSTELAETLACADSPESHKITANIANTIQITQAIVQRLYISNAPAFIDDIPGLNGTINYDEIFNSPDEYNGFDGFDEFDEHIDDEQ